MLLEVKDFLHKNKKLAQIYKGPYVITRISDNNTATVKTPHGVKEYNYNTQMFKLFHPKKETVKEKEKEKHTETSKESVTKTKRQKQNLSGQKGWRTNHKIKNGPGKSVILCRNS